MDGDAGTLTNEGDFTFYQLLDTMSDEKTLLLQSVSEKTETATRHWNNVVQSLQICGSQLLHKELPTFCTFL